MLNYAGEACDSSFAAVAAEMVSSYVIAAALLSLAVFGRDTLHFVTVTVCNN